MLNYIDNTPNIPSQSQIITRNIVRQLVAWFTYNAKYSKYESPSMEYVR
jgi:hypothetical protein